MDRDLLKAQLKAMCTHINGPILILCTEPFAAGVTQALADLKLLEEERVRISVVDTFASGWDNYKTLNESTQKLKADFQEIAKLYQTNSLEPEFRADKPRSIGKKGLNSARNRVICKGGYC